MSAPSVAICPYGCVSATACAGHCQPPLHTKPCKWCAQGYARTDGEHWVVKSITRARVNIYPCTAVQAATTPAGASKSPHTGEA